MCLYACMCVIVSQGSKQYGDLGICMVRYDVSVCIHVRDGEVKFRIIMVTGYESMVMVVSCVCVCMVELYASACDSEAKFEAVW